MPNKIELPIKYYLSHFREVRKVLLDQYRDFFELRHEEFLKDFDALSEGAQCLYLRMVNRKGKFFRKETLFYEEIGTLDRVLEELLENKFLRSVAVDDFHDLVSIFTKKMLEEVLLLKNVPYKKSARRSDLVDLVTPLHVYTRELSDTFVVQERKEDLDYLLFLFFGRLQTNFSLHTLRDLGIKKVNQEKKEFTVRFTCQSEALSHFFFAKLRKDPPSILSPLEWPLPGNTESSELRDEVLLTGAEDLRKDGDLEGALSLLSFCNRHPGREKYARLLFQAGRKEECKQELDRIISDPVSDLELLSAEDFRERKFGGRKLGVLTETLRNARIVNIDESYFRSPEEGVLSTLGVQGFHLENYLWSALFGLLFWEELFEGDSASLHSEFDRLPSDLRNGRFYLLHEKAILTKLSGLTDQTRLLSDLGQKINNKKETPNGVFAWSESLYAYLEFFLSHAKGEAVGKVLLAMARDYSAHAVGFPDLVTLVDGEIKFFEVKAEGDVLKRHQLLQLRTLQNAGFSVEVLHVKYTYNPRQTYVVVDLETTGSANGWHRITEIGAVKLREGKVIDRFQSLVNPMRRISSGITELTGITNEMVRTAPKFAEVADVFEAFCKDAIFVAHNVSFDYGFLQSEFGRLDRRFVRPYVCTRALMKKHFPGLPSYGLKNLTAHFGVPLKTHHRAMCDAEAAAALLNLINQRRAEIA